ncbi:protein of unknown function [Ralstonia solanacearum CMR15]|nr:protein of unknown function [Ralstonia solanacearum CMR15]
MRILNDEERGNLLTLHRVCKAAQKSDVPYPFDWLLALLQATAQVYTIEVPIDSATVTLYASEGAASIASDTPAGSADEKMEDN